MPRTILLIDDDRERMKQLSSMLERAGLAVDSAETYEQATWHLVDEHYSAVILDIGLGGPFSRDGLVVLDFIRTYLPALRVIVITLDERPEIVREALHMNAHYYLEKPVAFIKLSAVLSELGVLPYPGA